MPGTGQHPDHQNVKHPASPADPVASHGNVHIVPEPAAKAHMPPAPEFRNTFGHVGIIKIFQEVETKHSAKTDGHIRIAGKIKIDIQRECDGVHPVKQDGRFAAFPEQLHQQSKVIRQDHLFAEAHQETAQTAGHVFPAVGTAFQFPGHVHIADNGASNQLGKQGHIGAEGDGVFLGLGITSVDVDGIA